LKDKKRCALTGKKRFALIGYTLEKALRADRLHFVWFKDRGRIRVDRE
jgi:hypothetical protein